MNGKAIKTAKATRRSADGTTESPDIDTSHTRTMATYETMYKAIATLLVVATFVDPSGLVLPLVPPAIARIRPTKRTLTGGADF
jgi:hypothetical protein